jgi:hypothetical protein
LDVVEFVLHLLDDVLGVCELVTEFLDSVVHSFMIMNLSDVLLAHCLIRGSTLSHCLFVPTYQVTYSASDWSDVLITLCVMIRCFCI